MGVLCVTEVRSRSECTVYYSSAVTYWVYCLLQQWDDEFLSWEPSEYGGVEDITVAQKSVWLPDLLVENT